MLRLVPDPPRDGVSWSGSRWSYGHTKSISGAGSLVTKNWAAIADDRTSRFYLPPGYRLEYDPDVLRLVRGSNGSVVAAFSVGGLTLAEVVRAAEEDYRANGRSTA